MSSGLIQQYLLPFPVFGLLTGYQSQQEPLEKSYLVAWACTRQARVPVPLHPVQRPHPDLFTLYFPHRTLYFSSHGHLLHLALHLPGVDQGRTGLYGGGNVYRFHHLLFVGAGLQAVGGVGIDAVGTLDGMADGQGDQ